MSIEHTKGCNITCYWKNTALSISTFNKFPVLYSIIIDVHYYGYISVRHFPQSDELYVFSLPHHSKNLETTVKAVSICIYATAKN